jgi:hypothetical protein
VRLGIPYPDATRLNRWLHLVGVGRWTNQVTAYAALMLFDEYPPFQLRP